ncbi:unnamed protein product [Somion occarium]|uniref:DUF6699 domain-containing protein n=1 Tax=Somion occarium TaxID=3059160 RepID=A0ABP1CT44_9APHY
MDGPPPLVDRPDDYDHGYPAGFGGISHQWSRPSDGWPPTQPIGSPWGSQAPSEITAGPSYFNPNTTAAMQQQWPPVGAAGFAPSTQPQFSAFPPPPPAPAMASWGAPMGMTPMMLGPQPVQSTREDDWVDVSNDRPNWEQAWPQGGFPTQSGRLAPRPLSRATSQASRMSGRQRSASHSSNTSPRSSNSAMLARHERAFEDEKRPPREWRADFSMTRPSVLASALGAMLSPARQGSIRRRNSDSSRHPKIELHPYIRYNNASPPMTLDLRDNPAEITFRALNRRINAWDLTRFACEPPVRRIELWNPYYPWLIEVESQNPAGVTLHELLGAIWTSMMTPISTADYYNNEMNENIRSKVAMAFNIRVEENEKERGLGVRRVDFLMDRIWLEGFVKGRDSRQWEMKIKKV